MSAVAPSASSSSSSSGRLVEGARGPAVQELQRLLAAAGFYGKKIDGQFGPVTTAAVKAFQKKFGLTVDGYAGPKTLAALRKATAPNTTPASAGGKLVRGATGPAVEQLQTLLRKAGHYHGNIGGTFGPQTEAAVKAFQARHGLTVDGWAGPQTMAALVRVTSGTTSPGPVAPTPAPSGPVPQGVQAAIAYGKSVLGSPYAAVNPFRFGEVLWDGGRHQSVNGSGTWFQYPRGTRVFDCSGFVVSCFKRAGVDLARHGLVTSGAIAANSNGFLQNLTRDQLRPGDLITYKSSGGVGHVVIYLGDGKTLEAAGGSGVKTGTVDWTRANAFRRVPVN
ncbi:MAG TPA: peptidoglycan-binding protein [Archangium sp.]